MSLKKRTLIILYNKFSANIFISFQVEIILKSYVLFYLLFSGMFSFTFLKSFFNKERPITCLFLIYIQLSSILPSPYTYTLIEFMETVKKKNCRQSTKF